MRKWLKRLKLFSLFLLPLSSIITITSCVVQAKKDNIKDEIVNPITQPEPKIEDPEIKDDKGPRGKKDILLSILNLYLKNRDKDHLLKEYENFKEDVEKGKIKDLVNKSIATLLTMTGKVSSSVKDILEFIDKNINVDDLNKGIKSFSEGKIIDDSDNFLDPESLWAKEFETYLQEQIRVKKSELDKEVFDYNQYSKNFAKNQQRIKTKIKSSFKTFLENHYWNWVEYLDNEQLIKAYNGIGEWQEPWHKQIMSPLLNKLKEESTNNLSKIAFRIKSYYKSSWFSGKYWTQSEYSVDNGKTWVSKDNENNNKNKEILWNETEKKYNDILSKNGKIPLFDLSYFKTDAGVTGAYDNVKSMHSNVNKAIKSINNYWNELNSKSLQTKEQFDKNLIDKWGSDDREKAKELVDKRFEKDKNFKNNFYNNKFIEYLSHQLSKTLKLEEFIKYNIANNNAGFVLEDFLKHILKSSNFVKLVNISLNMVKIVLLEKPVFAQQKRITAADFSKIMLKLKQWFEPEGFRERFKDEIFPKLYPFLKQLKIKVIIADIPTVFSLFNLHEKKGISFLTKLALDLANFYLDNTIVDKITPKLEKINETLNKVNIEEISSIFDEIDLMKIINIIGQINEKNPQNDDFFKDIMKIINNLLNFSNKDKNDIISLIENLADSLKEIIKKLQATKNKNLVQDFIKIIKNIVKVVTKSDSSFVVKAIFAYLPDIIIDKNAENLIIFVKTILIQLIELSEKKEFTINDFIKLFETINNYEMTNSKEDLKNRLNDIFNKNKCNNWELPKRINDIFNIFK